MATAKSGLSPRQREPLVPHCSTANSSPLQTRPKTVKTFVIPYLFNSNNVDIHVSQWVWICTYSELVKMLLSCWLLCVRTKTVQSCGCTSLNMHKYIIAQPVIINLKYLTYTWGFDDLLAPLESQPSCLHITWASLCPMMLLQTLAYWPLWLLLSTSSLPWHLVNPPSSCTPLK